MAAQAPSNITVAGRLSYPVFTQAAAVVRNGTSQYPKKDDAIAPEYNLLLEQVGLDKITKFILDEFLPGLTAQFKAGDKKYEKFDAKTVSRLEEAIQAGDWDTQPPYLFIKPVPEKTVELAPEAVAMIKINGNRGQDLELKAIVRTEAELAIPDNDVLDYPLIKNIGQTVHEMYAGCVAGTTLNLYAYINGKLPGIAAGGPKLVFKSDADSFGGGAALDEEALFLDD